MVVRVDIREVERLEVAGWIELGERRGWVSG